MLVHINCCLTRGKENPWKGLRGDGIVTYEMLSLNLPGDPRLLCLISKCTQRPMHFTSTGTCRHNLIPYLI